MKGAARLLAGAAALLAVTPAAGQTRPDTIQIGFVAGRSFRGTISGGSTVYYGSAEISSDNDILTGGFVGYQFTPGLAAELLVTKVNTRLVATGNGVFPVMAELGTLDLRFVEAGPRWTFLTGRFVPFAGFGAGIAVMDPDVPEHPEIRDSTRFSFTFNGGVQLYVARHFGFRVDVRYRFVYLGPPASGSGGFFNGERWFKQPDLDVGLFVSF